MSNEETDINNWFLAQADSVRDNSKIFHKAQIGTLYHIDKNIPKEFIPRMPTSAAISENFSVARVTVATTLIGCLLAYYRVSYDFTNKTAKDKRDVFRGGYEISEIDYEYCIKPNKKLVFDAMNTDEHWLVNYNALHKVYIPKPIGKIFINSIKHTSLTDKVNKTEYEFYLQVDSRNKFRISDKKSVGSGTYKIVSGASTFNDCNNIIIEEIPLTQYLNAKKYSAALLSADYPNYSKW